jgi:hypothetical protein
MKCWLLVKRNNTARSPVLPSPQQLWQFCEVRRDATGLVADEPLHRHAAAVLVFKIDIAKRPPPLLPTTGPICAGPTLLAMIGTKNTSDAQCG